MQHVLHIGLEKTGTTSLQQYVFDTYEDQVCYLGKYSSRCECYEPLKSVVRGERSPEDVRQELEATVEFARDNEPVVLWSCAKLAHNQLADQRTIARRLATVIDDPTVLITIRRQQDICVSQYFNFVSRGSCDSDSFRSFASNGLSFLRTHKEQPSARVVRQPGYGRDLWAVWTLWRYGTLLDQWEAVFDDVVVLPLEAWHNDSENARQLLEDLLGVDCNRITLPKNRARSRTDNLTKHAIRVLPGTKLPAIRMIASWLRDCSHSGNVPEFLHSLVKRFALTATLSPEQENSLEEIYGPENISCNKRTRFDLAALGYPGL